MLRNEAKIRAAFDVLPAATDGMLSKDGVLLRCFLVGGGGCGKTCMINKVLKPLLTAPSNKADKATSNKAARLIHGRTIHALATLGLDLPSFAEPFFFTSLRPNSFHFFSG